MTRIGTFIAILLMAGPVWAQSSAIGKNHRGDADRQAQQVAAREVPLDPGNPTLQEHSLISVAPAAPKKFKVNDYITIIVRQQTIYEADATANSRRQADLRSELDSFLKFTGGGVGAAAFRRGQPNINYRGVFNQRNTGELDREDRLTTRVTARIIDVKPNGNLILEARATTQHDEETHTMRLTGGCRNVDVTPDNSVLSTQLADLHIDISTRGGVRRAVQQGWVGKIYDWIRPL